LLDLVNHWLAGVFAGEAPTPPLWHYTTLLDAFDHWQTLIAGAGALGAALLTVWVIREQIETTVRLEQNRVVSETNAFLAMLEAVMARLMEETPWARGAVATSVVRTVEIITKVGFEELRGGCIRLGSPLTGEFLDLEREIDSFRLGLWDKGLGLKKLDTIEIKAIKLRNKAVSTRIVRGVDSPDDA
jgi:hypothetical protein